jgi:hypothetical protein
MSRKAFIHINGVDYENAYPVDGESSPEFQALEQKIEKLTSGGGTQIIFDVIMGGERAKLHTTTQSIFAGAVFLAKEGARKQGRVIVMD